jgi:flavin-binding protein dodecin
MVQKVSEIVGVSTQSFARAAEDAIKEAGKTVRGMKWARISEFEMELDESKIKSYRATVRIYFDIER